MATPQPLSTQISTQIDAAYAELRRLAGAQMRQERCDHTLSATGLVNEAYLRLSESDIVWESRGQFLGIAARAMRQILVEHARAHQAEKRGGNWLKLTLTSAVPEIERAQENALALDVLGLDDALKKLEALDPRQASVVELRYFGGLSIEETAAMLNVSQATIKREWVTAKLFLKHELSK